MIVSLPTPDGREMMMSIAPGRALDRARRSPGDPVPASGVRRRRSPSRRALEHDLELGWQGAVGPDEMAVRRRGELEPPGMEEESAETVGPRRDVPVP